MHCAVGWAQITSNMPLFCRYMHHIGLGSNNTILLILVGISFLSVEDFMGLLKLFIPFFLWEERLLIFKQCTEESNLLLHQFFGTSLLDYNYLQEIFAISTLREMDHGPFKCKF